MKIINSIDSVSSPKYEQWKASGGISPSWMGCLISVMLYTLKMP